MQKVAGIERDVVASANIAAINLPDCPSLPPGHAHPCTFFRFRLNILPLFLLLLLLALSCLAAVRFVNTRALEEGNLRVLKSCSIKCIHCARFFAGNNFGEGQPSVTLA